MFKKTLTAIALITSMNSFGVSAVYGVGGTLESSVYMTASPVIFLRCMAKPEIQSNPECVFSFPAAISAVSTSSTLLLLKEVQAVQPDALNYIAGAAPSPMLYDTVEKLQSLSAETLGQELSFDEIVNDIINTL